MFNSDLQAASNSPSVAPLRAVTLVRVSTADQAQEGKAGMARQREANARVVRSKGYHLLDEVEIVDVSGTATFLCPEIQSLIRMAEAGKFDILVISEMSRLIRPNALGDLVLLDNFQSNGVKIDAGGTVLCVDKASDFLTNGIQLIVSGFERKAMLQKVMASKEAARAAGRNPGSDITLPLGLSYDRENRKYYYDSSIDKVKEAFAMIDGDTGLRNISEVGRRVGIEAATLRNILRNKSYIGIREYTQKRDLSTKKLKPGARQGDRPKVARLPEEVIRVRIIPPEAQAVSDEQFERVQLILDSLKESYARIKSERSTGGNLIAGVGRCGCCGERLYASTTSKLTSEGEKRRGHYICYSAHYSNKDKTRRCGLGWLNKDEVEPLVSAFVCEMLGEESFIAKILEHAKAKRRDLIKLSDTSESLRRRLDEIARKDKRVVESLMAEVLSIPEAKQARTRLEEEKAAILRSIKCNEERGEENLDPVTARLVGRADAWRNLESTSDRKEFLASIFAEIYIQRTKKLGLVISAFRLAPGLIGKGEDKWGWLAEIPVTLAEPYRIGSPPDTREIGQEESLCKRCDKVLPLGEFYAKNKSSCKACLRVTCTERYRNKRSDGEQK